MTAISVKATVLYTCFFIIVRWCSAETCKINLMVQCIGCLLCSVAEIHLIAVEWSGMSPSDNRSLKICCLNARLLRNKSAAFVELVNDLKADLFTICETWLSVNDSTVLNELTPTGYNTL